MAPLYKYICELKESNWKFDEALYAGFKIDNEAHLKEVEAKLEDAKDNLGASEVFEALTEKALYLGKILQKVFILCTVAKPLMHVLLG